MVTRIRLVGLPGSGKTTRLIAEVDTLLSQGYKPQDIIFCSHSNASVYEAKDRIDDQYSSLIQFTTIHSLAKKLLTKHKKSSYLKILDLTGESTHSYDINILEDYLLELHRKYKRKEKFVDLDKYQEQTITELERYNSVRNYSLTTKKIKEITEQLIQLSLPQLSDLQYYHSSDPRIGGIFNDLSTSPFLGFYNLIQIIETAYCIRVIPENRKILLTKLQAVVKSNQIITYEQITDIILDFYRLVHLFRGNAYSFNDVLFEVLNHNLQPKGKILIIDEYQDIGKLQYDISELWAKEMDIFMVAGDPNQSIYGFNGVSPEFLENFSSDREILLSESHRVPSKVIEYAQKVLNNIWTTQMTSLNTYSGTYHSFSLEETIFELFSSVKEYKSIYVLCRSDEIIKQVEMQFASFGLLSIHHKFSSDFTFLGKIVDIYSNLESKIKNQTCRKDDIEEFLSNIQKLESSTDQNISQYFNRLQVSSWYRDVDLNKLQNTVAFDTIAKMNLLNLNPEHYTTTVKSSNISSLSPSSNHGLFGFKPFQIKRIHSRLLDFIKQVEKQTAGIKELDDLLALLSTYEKREEVPIRSKLEVKAIENWRKRVKFQNFTNKVRYHHLESFGITELMQQVELVVTGGNYTVSEQTSIPIIKDFIPMVMKQYQDLIIHLIASERIILDNLIDLKLKFSTMQQLRKRIKFMTMHASKGREADLIIIPDISTYYEDRKLTDPDETRRVYFVAITRTKKDLIILRDQFNGNSSRVLAL